MIIYDIYNKMIGREENLMLNGNHRKAEEKHFEVLKNEELATVQGGGSRFLVISIISFVI